MEHRKKSGKRLAAMLFIVLCVRLIFLGFFHHQMFSGPSTLFDQAFVALNLLKGQGVQAFRTPPEVFKAGSSSEIIDPEYYVLDSAETLPYIREVTGYAFFLAFLWMISGSKLWIFAQIAQIVFEVLAGLGLFLLARKFLSQRAAWWTLGVFAFLFFEARLSIVPYKDLFLLYFMLIIAFFSAPLVLRKGKPLPWFSLLCLFIGIGFYFMPSIIFYPLFLAVVLLLFKRVNLKVGLALVLLSVVIVGLAAFPYQAHLSAHRGKPGVADPLFWYRFWLGTKVRSFYSTEEERFQDYFKEKLASTGLRLEELCKQEFLNYVSSHPAAYILKSLKKLLWGMFLVYGNSGDATYEKSWNFYKTQNPEASFLDYARSHPFRILGMVLGTLSISLLFPLSLVAVIILVKEKKGAQALLFFHLPLYYLLLHMFFHYEARYLLGTLPGYLPLTGFLLAKVASSLKRS